MKGRRGSDGPKSEVINFDSRYMSESNKAGWETRRQAMTPLRGKSKDEIHEIARRDKEQAERDVWMTSVVNSTDRIKDFGNTPDHGKRDSRFLLLNEAQFRSENPGVPEFPANGGNL